MSATLMESLKQTTLPSHQTAEGSDFQGYLFNGKLPLSVYIQYLGQLYLVHRFMEQEMKRHAKSGNVLAKVIVEEQMQEEFLRKDLLSLSCDPTQIKALPATAQLLKIMEQYSVRYPEALLGFHYVMLGSKHGAKLVARNVKASYGFTEEAGALYFDPYGGHFMELWLKFKSDMNELSLTAEQQEEFCAAATEMFKGITFIGDALMASVVVR
ncbi:MAG: biliverdin-producing heme oxygenase [Candidatus Obscuribacterales bacterium]|jgi:heme oxygenase|nr:biliverdin-producing heme oxygenase [Candidatus Obscuribacterales bacterium]